MHGLSLIQLFSRFAMLGAEWVMWVLIGLSLLSIAIMVERWVYYRSLSDDLTALGDEVNRRLDRGDSLGAEQALSRSPSPAAYVALAGLLEADRGAEAVERVMMSAVARVRARLDSNLSILGTIGNNAPFIGLFGTVIGIIQAFDALKPQPGVRGAAAAAAAQAAQGRVMGTIAEALVATAIGLLVAIPAVAFFNFFQRRVKMLLAGTEALSQLVLSHVHKKHPDDDLGQLVRLLRGDREHAADAANGAPDVHLVDEGAHVDTHLARKGNGKGEEAMS